jgi:hypothetical protein
MNTATADMRAPLRQLTARRCERAAREYYGATDRENCERVLKLIALRAPGTTWVHVRKFCAQLPHVVRIERDAARAIADDIDPIDAKSQAAYRDATKRAAVLSAWGKQCEFVSTQTECLELVRRALAERTP